MNTQLKNTPRAFDLFDDRKKKAACFRLVDHNDTSAQVVADIYRDDIAGLLQAAPNMLEALKDVSQWCEHNGCGVGNSAEPMWLEDVNAAIAKAEGSE